MPAEGNIVIKGAKVNNLKFHHYSHLSVVGWMKGF